MATSFATYASQFLNRQNNGMSLSQTSSQPMFYSFTADGNGSHDGHSTDLDDLNDPHLRSNHGGRHGQEAHAIPEADDDPYLRLDEDENTGRTGYDNRAGHQQSIPLIASEHRSESPDSPRGWLAHLASPPMRRPRSPSPVPSTDSGDSEPPPDLLVPGPSSRAQRPPPAPPATKQPQSLSLTQSLLPRDGLTRPLDVFSLPDPRYTPRRRRKHNDSIWTVLWCTGVSLCVFFSILVLFVVRKPQGTKNIILPYTTLLHTVPLLTITTFSSAIVTYVHVFLLRIFVRPVMIVTSFFVPVTLLISAIWAFVGSFMWDGNTEPTWGETVGLRLFSLIPLVLSIITARRLLHLPETLHVASSTLTLTTHLLMNNPFLLALSPAILLLMLISSLPFLTLIFRLLLAGYPSKEGSVMEYHVYTWANWAIFGSVVIWLWTWGVARGILRMTSSSVVGAWYFADPDAQPPPPMSTHTIHAALVRSTGPSLGTVALSALLLTVIQMLYSLTLLLHQLPAYIPARAFFLLHGVRMAINWLESATTALSKYALVYAGLTGDPFMHSARRARALTNSVEGKIGRYGRRKISSEPPLALLTIAPLSMTFPFSLTTYLFVAHTLSAPDQALGAAMLAGGVTSLVGLFCVGLVKDTADTLYICYCIDKETGDRRREEVFILFEHGQPQPNATSPSHQRTIPQPPQTQQPAQDIRQQDRKHRQPPSPLLPIHNIERTPPTTRSALPSGSLYQTQRPVPLSPSAAAIPKTSAKAHTSAPPLHASVKEDLEAEDVDPFERSYHKDDNSRMTVTMTTPRASQEHPRQLHEQQQQRQQGAEGMLTSRELNMKSVFLNPRDNEEELSGSERGTESDESQIFPGSGFL